MRAHYLILNLVVIPLIIGVTCAYPYAFPLNTPGVAQKSASNRRMKKFMLLVPCLMHCRRE